MQKLVNAEQVVDAKFIAKSRASLEALKSANLLKSLSINALIFGDIGVGKTTLARYILNSPVVDAEESIDAIIKSLSQNDKIIIKNFDKIKHLDIFEEYLKKTKTRVIATSTKDIYDKISDRFFSLKINLPPLSQRKEDVYLLSKKFLNEAKEIFLTEKEIGLNDIKINLEKNCYSLRESIYKAVLENLCNEKDIMRILENILKHKMGTKDDYRKNLYLYEIPLINAGKKKFKSQSEMAKEFGINRNTLRKKINEYGIKI